MMIVLFLLLSLFSPPAFAQGNSTQARPKSLDPMNRPMDELGVTGKDDTLCSDRWYSCTTYDRQQFDQKYPVSSWDALAGMQIALYSLRESALRRTRGLLSVLCAKVDVQTFCTTVGGDSLRAAAVSSDVFVIAPAAASHAATDFIHANRPKSRITLYARGGGSASLLGAIRSYVDKSISSRPIAGTSA